MSKIKILYVLGAFGSGGVESVVKNIHQNINREKFQIDYVLFNGLDQSRKEDLNGYESRIYCINRSGEGIIRNISEIKRILAMGKYDIAHAHTNETSIFTAIAAKLARTPVTISHSHNTMFDRNRRILPLMRLGIKIFSEKLMACSYDAGAKLFGNKADFIVMKNAIDTENYVYDSFKRKKIRKELNIEESFVVGNVGRLNYQKNHSFILEIFKKVLEKKSNAKLVLVGDGELEGAIKTKIKELNLEEHVLMLGARKDVPDLLQAFDVFLFPSHFEGLGVSLIEAQCSGLPCIVSDVITKEVVATDLISFKSLEEDEENWAQEIINSELRARRNTKDQIVKAGYDVKSSTVTLEDNYMLFLKEKHL